MCCGYRGPSGNESNKVQKLSEGTSVLLSMEKIHVTLKPWLLCIYVVVLTAGDGER